jgi:NarL family two-component system response regulator LiaR
MIVDDHTVVRGGLKYFLLAFKDMELVAEASNGEETLRLCNQLRPDVVLMDMMMPGMDGIATTQAIRQRHPQTQVIALTSFQDEELVRKALQAGAIGYLLKNISIDDLAKAIRDAYAGRPTLAPEATHQLIQSSGRPAPPTYHLTSRELEVLALVVAGLSNIEIGHRLSVSHHTVRHHISSILTKLGAANRAEAAALAVQHRLIT